MLTPLQKYMMQRGMQGQPGQPGMAAQTGASLAGQPPTSKMPPTSVAPGFNDPYSQGDQSPPLTNPDDAMNEFDPRRRTRPYMAGGQSGMGS